MTFIDQRIEQNRMERLNPAKGYQPEQPKREPSPFAEKSLTIAEVSSLCVFGKQCPRKIRKSWGVW